jgi:hypothetical protein
MATAQSQLQTSLGTLAGVLVREMTDLLESRLDRLDTRRIETLVLAGLAILLALAAVLAQLTAGRRRSVAPSGADPGHDNSVPQTGPDLVGNSQHDHPPYGEEVYPTRRERSGALR